MRSKPLTEFDKKFLEQCFLHDEVKILDLLKMKEEVNINCAHPGNYITALHLTVSKYSIFKVLVCDYKANTNIQDLQLCTVLHYAVWGNFVDCVKLILQNGGNCNLQDTFGETPLFFAVRLKNEKLIKILIRNGASTTIRNNDNKTIFDLDENLSDCLLDVTRHYLYRKFHRWNLMNTILCKVKDGEIEIEKKKVELNTIKMDNNYMRSKIRNLQQQLKEKDNLRKREEIESLGKKLIALAEKREQLKKKNRNLRINCSTSPKKSYPSLYVLEKSKNSNLVKLREDLKGKILREGTKEGELKKKQERERERLYRKISNLKRLIQNLK